MFTQFEKISHLLLKQSDAKPKVNSTGEFTFPYASVNLLDLFPSSYCIPLTFSLFCLAVVSVITIIFGLTTFNRIALY